MDIFLLFQSASWSLSYIDLILIVRFKRLNNTKLHDIDVELLKEYYPKRSPGPYSYVLSLLINGAYLNENLVLILTIVVDYWKCLIHHNIAGSFSLLEGIFFLIFQFTIY